MIKKRYFEKIIESLCFENNKMAFISGPRQCGKTTFSKVFLPKRKDSFYYNWDDLKFRKQWTKDPSSVLSLDNIPQKKALIIFDELHKAKSWKKNLKGLYDMYNDHYDFLITGSVKLNTYRKGGDSLLGRYYHFRMHPFSLSELLNVTPRTLPQTLIDSLFQNSLVSSKTQRSLFKRLDKFGPFPDPYLKASEHHFNLWKRGRIEKLVREEIRDLSRISELGQIEMLVSLLPERAASSLSIKSLSEDLEVAYTTIKRWLDYLKEVYYIFEVKPYSKTIVRSLKKEGKLYLWDWSEIENEGARFENLIASHLLKYCHYLTDSGYGNFELNYVKDKQKREIDFVILKNKKPYLPIEVKQSQAYPSKNWAYLIDQLGCSKGIQVVKKENIFNINTYKHYDILSVSADKFLTYLV